MFSVSFHIVDVTPNTQQTPAATLSPYLADVLDQPRALAALLDSVTPVAEASGQLDLARRPRVIISGMGSSHYAGFGLWASLVKLGVPAWWVETAQLLDVAEGMVVQDSVLWLTSQSGESGETVALLDRMPGDIAYVVGVTNNPDSTLGRSAQTRIDLLAGDEATVSTKSYLNSLAVARLVAAQLTGTVDHVVASLRSTVDSLASYLAHLDENVASLDDFAAGKHLLLTGRGQAAASAQAAGLVIKEAAKAPVEGMTAGALRHGVIELAGPDLAVAFFDHGPEPHRDQNLRLAGDLSAAGTEIAWVSSEPVDHSRLLPAPTGDEIDLAIRDAAAFQTLSFQLAQRSGVTAGAFTFASKVTDIL
jgi:glucosamine--fructose-6-phosphate aminotransferase (isomerizing)